MVKRREWCNFGLTIVLLWLGFFQTLAHPSNSHGNPHVISQNQQNRTRNGSVSRRYHAYDEYNHASSGVAYVVPVAPVCYGQTYCEESDEYPEEIVNLMLRQDPSLLVHAAVDMITNVAGRSDSPEAELLCLSEEKVVYPKSGETISNVWKFIVNQPNFQQGVRIETCMDDESTCKVIDGFAEGYKTMCKQKYIYRQLSAIADDGKITRDYFRFPASCCCHVQFVGDNEDYYG